MAEVRASVQNLARLFNGLFIRVKGLTDRTVLLERQILELKAENQRLLTLIGQPKDTTVS